MPQGNSILTPFDRLGMKTQYPENGSDSPKVTQLGSTRNSTLLCLTPQPTFVRGGGGQAVDSID